MRSLRTQFLNEISAWQKNWQDQDELHFSDTDIRPLPTPVQRYFRTCGYIGSEPHLQGRILWSDVYMRFSATGSWRKIHCDEFLATPEPVRIAYMTAGVAGIPSFAAKDEYRESHGNMLIKLAGLIPLQNAKGREMDQSGLVTVLSECLLLPSYALQPYIQWTEKDPNCAAATIRFNGTEANGLFYFNDRGEFTRFETHDRWQAQKKGRFIRTPWKVTATDYIEDEGIRRPHLMSASWLDNSQWWEYFRGKIAGIRL
jgi:hypothetical protein